MKKYLIILAVLFGCFSGVTVCAENENGYIVRLKDEAIALFSVQDEFFPVGEKLYLSDSKEKALSVFGKDNIEKIFPDCELELFDLEYPIKTSDTNFEQQWYLESINAVCARKKGITGANVKVAVIDSGINAEHPDFIKKNISEGYNCVVNASDISDCSDNVGHGTMVSGIIAAAADNELGICGIAPTVNIIPIKITDENKLNLSSLLLGIRKAIDLECDIINMSLGGSITDSDAIAELEKLIKEAEKRGITVVAAAGNQGGSAINYPAGIDGVIGVGSTDEDNLVSWFSQQNSSVFVTAPGNGIITLNSSGNIIESSGTSMSTPIVVASIALIKQLMPQAGPQEIRQILIKTCVDEGDTGYDIAYGYGIINIGNILELLEEYIPGMIITSGVINSMHRIHIHNNSPDMVTANLYFASSGNNGITVIPGKTLACGVTSIIPQRSYDKFFLWNENLKPYTSIFPANN